MMNKQSFVLGIMLIFLIVNISAVVEPIKYYEIDLTYVNPNVTVNEVNVIFSNKEIVNSPGTYLVRVLGYDNNELELDIFNIESVIIAEGSEEESGFGGKTIVLDRLDFKIYVPYNEKGKTIVLYDPLEKELARVDVSMISKDIVKDIEDYKTNIVKEGNNVNSNEDDNTDKNEVYVDDNTSNRDMKWIIILSIAVLILVGILIYLLIKKKKK